MSDFRRSTTSGWILAGVAALFAGLSAVIVVSIARIDPGEILHPAFLALAGAPLLLALGIGAVAMRHLGHQPILLSLDGDAVRVGARPPLPWAEVAAIIHRSAILGYGPRDHIVFRSRRAPSDIAARRAEAAVHALFTDRSVRPADLGRSVAETLADIDTALAAAGYRRGPHPRQRFRGLWLSRSWPVTPM